MSRKLDDLTSEFKPLAIELLARLTERKVAVLIVDTLRTEQEQAAYVAKGVSKTYKSKHLPRAVRRQASKNPSDEFKSDAIDLVPLASYTATTAGKTPRPSMKAQWAATYNNGSRELRREWRIIGEEARKLGLVWGGAWRTFKDYAHVELDLSTR